MPPIPNWLRHTPQALALAISLLIPAQPALSTPPPTTAPLHPIPHLNLTRYLGTWYEIAKFPNVFQRGCVGGTQAQYTALPQGGVQVLNRCRQANGEWQQAVGEARLVGDTGTPKLQVRFAPAWLSFLPLVWGNYWVIDLDEAYELAAVSEPGRDYLWVLSRTPQVPAERYEALLARLQAQGLAVEKLERTLQP